MSVDKSASRTIRHAHLWDRQVLPAAILGYTFFYILFFSPVLLGGGSFLAGDTLLYHYPAVMGPWSTWSDTLMSGYPVFADSQAMTWYPVRVIGTVFGFSCFAGSAYVIASVSTFGFVREITNESWGAALAGLCYGLSGFMMAHLGHTAIIHAAAWLPLILWALRRISTKVDGVWIVIGAVAICLCFLAGHPQIFVNAILCAGAYALFLLVTSGRRPRSAVVRLVLADAAVLVLGVGLCSIQILPLIELAPLSLRGEKTPELFFSYALTAVQWPMLVFPNVLGGFGTPWSNYFGPASNIVEVSAYVGLSALVLVPFAVTARRSRAEALFWIAIAVFAIAYAFGDLTLVGRAAYHVPILSTFRAPGRMLLLLTLALAILSGLGLARIRTELLSGRQAALNLGMAAAAILLVLVAFRSTYPAIGDLASLAGAGHPRILSNAAVVGPLLAAAAMAVLAALALRRRSGVVLALMLCVLVADLGSFGWFSYWRHPPGAFPTLAEPVWDTVRDDLRRDGRILSLSGVTGPVSGATPNLNHVFGLPLTTGYGPLSLTRYVEATGMTLAASMTIASNPALADLLDVKWLAAGGVGGDDVPLVLGRICGFSGAGPLRATLPADVPATRLELVSSMGCSQPLNDDVTVLSIAVTNRAGSDRADLPLEAGRDTSEWAIDQAPAHHRKAHVAQSFAQGNAFTYRYGASLPLTSDGTVRDVGSVTLTLPGDAPVVNIFSMTLVNDVTGVRTPFPLWRLQVGEGAGWAPAIATASGAELIRRTSQGPGPAWLVQQVRRDTGQAVATTVRTGRFADGTSFEPARTALLEDAVPDGLPPTLGQGRVELESKAPGALRLKTHADAPAFLVVSQSDYPGWSAQVNGRDAHLMTVDHAFQGLVVPAGDSDVTLTFASKSLRYGGLLTGVCLLVAGLLVAFSGRLTPAGDRTGSASRG